MFGPRRVKKLERSPETMETGVWDQERGGISDEAGGWQSPGGAEQAVGTGGFGLAEPVGAHREQRSDSEYLLGVDQPAWR